MNRTIIIPRTSVAGMKVTANIMGSANSASSDDAILSLFSSPISLLLSVGCIALAVWLSSPATFGMTLLISVGSCLGMGLTALICAFMTWGVAQLCRNVLPFRSLMWSYFCYFSVTCLVLAVKRWIEISTPEASLLAPVTGSLLTFLAFLMFSLNIRWIFDLGAKGSTITVAFCAGLAAVLIYHTPVSNKPRWEVVVASPQFKAQARRAPASSRVAVDQFLTEMNGSFQTLKNASKNDPQREH